MMKEKKFSQPQLSIVLVNYKSPEMTTICMDLLQKSVDVSVVPVWVVDNDSKDESLAFLKSLNWINLIERKPVDQEAGFMAHGCALDLVLKKVTTKYLLLLHTDTFVHDASIIQIMLDKCLADDMVVAVGCREPEARSLIKNIGRMITRGSKYYFRKIKVMMGMKSRPPRPHFEVYLKSYCALWNVEIIRRNGMSFSMGERTPSYEMQDRLPLLGYKIVEIPAKTMFDHLDHIEKGTISATNGFRKNHRRVGDYQKKLGKFSRNLPDVSDGSNR